MARALVCVVLACLSGCASRAVSIQRLEPRRLKDLDVRPGGPFAVRPGTREAFMVSQKNILRCAPNSPPEALLSSAHDGIVDLCFVGEDSLFVLTRAGLALFYGGELVSLETPGRPLSEATVGIDSSRSGTGLRGTYSFEPNSIHHPPLRTDPDAVVRVDESIRFVNSESFALPLASRDLAATWSGFLKVARDGEYRFEIESTNGPLRYDGTRLFIHHRLVASVTGSSRPTRSAGSARLEAGLHPIRMEYVATGGTFSSSLRWRPPESGVFESVPTESLYPSPQSQDHRHGCLAGDASGRVWVAWETAEGRGRLAILDGGATRDVLELERPIASMASAPDGVFFVSGSTLGRVVGEGDRWRVIPLAFVLEKNLVSVESDHENRVVYLATEDATYAYADGMLRPILPLGGRIRASAEHLYLSSSLHGRIVVVAHPNELVRKAVASDHVVLMTEQSEDSQPRQRAVDPSDQLDRTLLRFSEAVLGVH